MNIRPRVGFLLVVGLVAMACFGALRSCSAAEAASGDTTGTPDWIGEVTLNGFLSSSYSYNFNRPPLHTNQFRVFDVEDNTFAVDEFELVAQKAVAKPRDAGFRVDLTLGSSVPHVTASAGLFRDPSGVAEDVDIHQAFASAIAPIGTGLRFDVGKFITPFGYEVIDGYDGWNDNATRSLLFGYAIPFTHVGVRVSYTLAPQVTSSVMVVNGWDVARDNNRSKSVGAQLTTRPLDRLTVTVTGMSGPEQPDDNSNQRNLFDVVVVFRAHELITIAVNSDQGAEELTSGEEASWTGVSGYARIDPPGPLALSLRAEYFDDPDGVRTGVPQILREATATPEVRVSPHMLVRADLRADRSNHRVFLKSDGSSDTQPTALLQAIYSF